jgi:RimJ/RimL family protein N-acetyltransferase
MVLLPLSRTMVQRRLEDEEFTLACRLEEGEADVRFPASWPGEALVMFPGHLRRMPPSEDSVPGQFTAVSTQMNVAVGQLGVIGEPSPQGEQELGYGFNREVWGRGLATEAVAALAAHLLTWDSVRVVTAQTAVDNPASGRVAEKAGFVRVGTSWNEDDGDLVTWRFVGPGA